MVSSRADYYWTHDSHSFNATVFAQTQSYWTGPVIDIQMGANARLARVQTSNKTNPTFSMSDLGDAFSIGETAAYIGILGDVESGTVKRELVEYLFGESTAFSFGGCYLSHCGWNALLFVFL